MLNVIATSLACFDFGLHRSQEKSVWQSNRKNTEGGLLLPFRYVLTKVQNVAVYEKIDFLIAPEKPEFSAVIARHFWTSIGCIELWCKCSYGFSGCLFGTIVSNPFQLFVYVPSNCSLYFLYSLCSLLVSAHLCTVTFDLMYCDLWISKFKKEQFPRKLYEEIW